MKNMAQKVRRMPDNGMTGRISEPKIFVLDTNVVLHDHNAIFNFQENDVYIPVTVIEELDKFKKGDDNLGYNARYFVRELDKISCNTLFDKGIRIGKGRGLIKIEMGHPYTEQIKASLMDDIPDHRIIATAMWLHQNNPDRKVILVTKDVNMRLKAKALGLMAQDYLSDKVEEKKIVRTEKETICVRNAPDWVYGTLSEGNTIDLDRSGIKRKPFSNQLFKFISGKNTVLARYDGDTRKIVRVSPGTAYGISTRNDEQAFALDAVLNPNVKLVSLTGMAGSGKTLLALAGALEQADRYGQIILTRPVIPLRQEPEFMSGNISEKTGPYMLPLFDNLDVIRNRFGKGSRESEEIEKMLRTEKLVISPLAFVRGRSLNNVFFIVDEAQNLTPHEVKTIITRAGEGTKMVFTGDIYQIDQPYLDINSNGLTHLGESFRGKQIFEHVNLVRGERSELSVLAGKLL